LSAPTTNPAPGPADSSEPRAAQPQAGHSTTGKASARSVLEAPRPPITRYRPVVVGGAVLAVLLAVGLGFLIAFGGGHGASRPVAEPPPPETVASAPVDDRLPASYGALGPPPASALAPPGGGATASTSAGPPGAASGPTGGGFDPVRQRRLEEQAAAQRAGPFFGGAPAAPVETPAPAALPPASWPGPASGSPASSPDVGGPKEAFIARASAPGPAYAPGALAAPLSPHEVKAGSVIAAAMVTGLNSDLPGLAIAQVTEPVFDHRSGRIVLIPQGARLIGKYDSQVGYGQTRVLVVWTRLIFPSGRSVELGAMTGADATGAAGLSDQVDAHLPRLARAIGLSTLISIGASAAQNSQARGSDNLILQDAAGGVAGQASQTGQRLVDRDLQRAPTLRIRPGYPVRVMVDKDLILPPEVEAIR
jgi:type IV secretion system protein VirB10